MAFAVHLAFFRGDDGHSFAVGLRRESLASVIHSAHAPVGDSISNLKTFRAKQLAVVGSVVNGRYLRLYFLLNLLIESLALWKSERSQLASLDVKNS